MTAVLGDPALYAFTGGTPLAPDELRDRYTRLVAGSGDPEIGWLNWVVRLREDSSAVGTVQATVTRDDAGAWSAEVAWVIGTAWQGRGFAQEAAQALVAWLARGGVRVVVAHVHPDHAASAAVAAAAGLERTAELHDGEVRWRRDLAR